MNRTLADLWRVHKSRIKKKYYTKYNSDEERLQNRPEDIPLEDFKQLLIYWGDDEIKVLKKIFLVTKYLFIQFVQAPLIQ